MTMITILVIAANIVVMGFLILSAIVDNGDCKKLGPRELIWFFVGIWIVGCMAGAV